MSKNKSSDARAESNRVWVYSIVSSVVVLWAAFAVAIPYVGGFFSEHSFEKSGSLGDSFGALNALFTGLAFGGVILTMILQRKELELQREELAETKNIHADSLVESARASTALETSIDESKKTRTADVYLRLEEMLTTLRPYWHQLYELNEAHPYSKGWNKDQKHLADLVCTGLQRVAYVIEMDLINGRYIIEGYAGTYANCWNILEVYVKDYREECNEPRELEDNPYQRRHLESFAMKCIDYNKKYKVH